MKTINEANILPGNRVFVRIDLNVPIENGEIKEAFRLEAALPTLKYILDKGAVPVIAGHIGEPKGTPVAELSTHQLAFYFDKHLGKNTYELLENLRFSAGEENNDEAYAREISQNCQIYVNDAFSVCHRKHASIVGIPQILPAYAGFRLMAEVEALSKLITEPARPFAVVIGGAKLESKKPTVAKFLPIADSVLLGGKLGTDWHEEVPANLVLPTDYANEYKDIGPQTIENFVNIIRGSKTILWAGPVDVFEQEDYFVGSESIAQAMVNATQEGAFSVAGGGETITAIDKAGLLKDFSFISTGGGAMLEFLVEGTLPGIKVLN